MNSAEDENKNKYFSSDRIFELAKQFGLESDYSIAKACDVKQPSVSYWRKRTAMISLRIAVNFCKSVGISYHDYLGKETEVVDDNADIRAWNSLSDRQKMAVRAYRNYVIFCENMGLDDDSLAVLTESEKMISPYDFINRFGDLIERVNEAPPKEDPVFISSNEDGETKRKTLSIKDEDGKEWTFTVGELAAARELLEYIRSEERFFNKPYIKTSEGVDFYSIGEDQFKKIAIEAGAFFKFAKSTIVCREDFEKYIKDHYKVKRRSPEDYWGEKM